MNIQIPTNKIVEKELSYKIVGILFEVHTKLGGRYQEKIYQAAVEKLLQRDKIVYTRELPCDLIFEGARMSKALLLVYDQASKKGKYHEGEQAKIRNIGKF